MPVSASTPSVVPPRRQRSAVWGLVAAYTALIGYASLYPFAPWQGTGLPWWGFITQPLPHYWTGFDVLVNVLGYMPLGVLLTLAALRDRGQRLPRWGALLGVAGGVLLSLGLETLQNWLPQRVPSNVDWLLNSAGGAVGAVLAWRVGKAGALGLWANLRAHWFVADAQEALVLLLLWPVALLYPLPVPLGLGQVQERLENALAEWFMGTPFADWLPLRSIERQPMLAWHIALAVALGALVPCLLAYGTIPAPRRRALAAGFLLVAGVLSSALGTALGYGPQHAWAWLWQPVQTGLAAAVVLAAGCLLLPRVVCKVLALLALGGQLYLLNNAGVSAYFGWGLGDWLPGRFIRFYGITEWLGWLWPYAVLLYLLVRLGDLARQHMRRRMRKSTMPP